MITKEKKVNSAIEYEAKSYEHLIGMKGFSDKLLKDHFKLYQGYVLNTNTALEKLKKLPEKSDEMGFNETRRRLGWEFNGMRLHEYYFDNLGGKEPIEEHPHLAELVKAQFGSIDHWKKDFIAAGAMRGIGWVILYQDPQANRLVNFWIEEHQANHPAGAKPLLVMDVFEHAFMTDYGIDKAAYIDAFFDNIDWNEVARRSA